MIRLLKNILFFNSKMWGRRGRDRMVVRFTTTYAISANHYWCCVFEQCQSLLMLCVRISIRARCTTLWDTVCQWLATGRWFSQDTLVSSTNKTDHQDITYQQSFESQVLGFFWGFFCPPSTFISIPIKYIQKHKSGQKNILKWQ